MILDVLILIFSDPELENITPPQKPSGHFADEHFVGHSHCRLRPDSEWKDSAYFGTWPSPTPALDFRYERCDKRAQWGVKWLGNMFEQALFEGANPGRLFANHVSV